MTIVHKAIERNPAQRYQTAALLAEDLQRFLHDEPVLARRASIPERLVRWARQHAGMAAALAIIALLLLGTAVASTFAAWRFQHLAGEKEAALGDAIRARNEANNARDVERWERYRSNIAAASAALQLQNSDAARPALDAAPMVHRDWEWRHFHSQLDGASLVIGVPGGPVRFMALSPSGRQVAVACENDARTYVFDAAFGTPIAVVHGHLAPVTSLGFSPDGRILATGARDGTIREWDPATGRERAVLRGPPGRVDLIFSPDGRRIFARMGDQIELWDPVAGTRVASLGPHAFPDAETLTTPFNGLGRHVISGRGTDICKWDASTGKLVATIGRSGSPVNLLAISPSGKRIAAVAWDESDFGLWNGDDGKEVATLSGHKLGVVRLGFSPDGARLLSAARYPDCVARLWDAATGRLVSTLSGHTNSIHSIAFSPDARRVCTGSLDNTARLWDGVTGELIAVLRGHTAKLWTVLFSPDSGRVVTTAEDATLRLWDARSGELILVLRGHGGAGSPFPVAPIFTPDGSHLLSASPDGTVPPLGCSAPGAQSHLSRPRKLRLRCRLPPRR